MRPSVVALFVLGAVLLSSALVDGAAAADPPWAIPAARNGAVPIAPGTISSWMPQANGVLTPDGRELYFSVTHFGRGGTIVLSRWRDGVWSEPQVAPFSGTWYDVDISLAPDGNRAFFISRRPLPGGGYEPDAHRIWTVAREERESAWGIPEPIGPPVDSPYLGGHEWHPVVTADGMLYFSSQRSADTPMQLFSARREPDGRYASVQKLPAPVNEPGVWTIDPYLPPDGRYLLFSAAGRADSPNDFDFYLSERDGDGWSEPRRLPDEVNSPADEYSTYVTPDGEYLIFVSLRGFGDHPLPRPIGYRDLLARHTHLGNGYPTILQVHVDALGLGHLRETSR